jgi:diguanylate cyclase (GGDEF)-like protein
MIPFLKQLKPSLFTSLLSGPASSGGFRLSILAVFIILLILLQSAGGTPVSLDLSFLLFILLAAFWFSVRGGVVAALLASFSFFPLAPDACPLCAGCRSIIYIAVGAAAGCGAELLRQGGQPRRQELLRACYRRLKGFSAQLSISIKFRIVVIVSGFVLLIGLRILLESFAISLGYVYLLFISLSGYWFGVRGGVIAAFAATVIGILELQLHREWTGRDFVINGMMLRFFIYFLEGVLIGYLHDLDLKFREEKRNKEYFEALAYHDELTGCVNFRWVMQLLEKEIALSIRYHTEMTLVMIDLDHFKKINDELGHMAGNDALRFFGGLLRGNVRTVDVAGRYGGDEFMLILHNASADEAVALLERVRELVAGSRFQSAHLAGRESPALTFSAGVVSCPRNGTNVSDLIEAGDNALYHAKEAGRDRVFVEQRCWVRLKPKPGLKAELFAPDGGYRKTSSGVRNVSQRGVLLLFPDGALPQNEFVCRISLGERSLSELKCRVVRKGKTQEGMYTVGIYFVEEPFVDVRQAVEFS